MFKNFILASLIVIYTLIVNIPRFIFERVIWLIGLPVIALAMPFKYYHPTKLTLGKQKLYQLPKFINYIWGNDEDGFGDKNYAVKDCGYSSLDEYNERAWFKQWVWLAWRNPCHNLNINFPLYHVNLKKVTSLEVYGTRPVSNRFNKDGTCQNGFQVAMAYGNNGYLRTGFYAVFRWFKTSYCCRIRIGFKLTEREIRNIGKPDKRLWTFTQAFRKKILEN